MLSCWSQMPKINFLVIILCVTTVFNFICVSEVTTACSCLHEGECVENRCQCPARHDGPRCEVLKLTLKENSTFQSQNVPPGDQFHISFLFITNHEGGTGTLLTVLRTEQNTKTIIKVALSKGKPTLLFSDRNNHNNTIKIDDVVNDNKWFRIDVLQVQNKLFFMLDWNNHLRKVDIMTDMDVTLPLNLTGAEVHWGRKDVGYPISMISPWDSTLRSCISEARINGVLQDMYNKGSKMSDDICEGEKSCGYSEKTPYGYCGRNGTCYGIKVETEIFNCRCKPQFAKEFPYKKRETCTIHLKSHDFLNSKVEWNLRNPELEIIKYAVQFRTVKSSGTLMDMTGEKKESFRVSIVNSKLLITMINKDGVVLSEDEVNVNVSNGEWNTLKLTRRLLFMEIQLQNNGTDAYRFIHNAKFESKRYNIRIAGDKKNSSDPFEGCMQGVKMLPEWVWFPMEKGITKSYITSITTENVGNNSTCPSYDVAHCKATKSCRSDQVPFVRWRQCGCQCPEEKFELTNKDRCVFKNVCLEEENLCKNNGTCVWNGEIQEELRNYTCTCPEGFTGRDCAFIIPVTEPPGTDKKTKKAGFPLWVIIIILALFILLFVIALLCFLSKSRRRKLETARLTGEDYDVDEVYENTVQDQEEGGGEGDFTGHIDFDLLRKPKQPPPPIMHTPTLPLKSAPNKPQPPLPFDWKNPINDNDDHLDHPLEYGYEGGGSAVTLSSLGSGTTDRDLDFAKMNNWGPRFRGLAELYQ